MTEQTTYPHMTFTEIVLLTVGLLIFVTPWWLGLLWLLGVI